jgi:Flp pilus assembly protein TadB
LKTTNSKAGKYPYRVLNWIFLSVLILILAYSALFSPEKKNHPIPSGSRFFSNAAVPSTGLSRSFSAIMRFRFYDARQYNPHGIRVFLFFFIQIFMRIAALVFVSRLRYRSLKPLIYIDAVISVALFVACFWPFLTAFYINSLTI